MKHSKEKILQVVAEGLKLWLRCRIVWSAAPSTRI